VFLLATNSITALSIGVPLFKPGTGLH
jgi:hypothetical protein